MRLLGFHLATLSAVALLAPGCTEYDLNTGVDPRETDDDDDDDDPDDDQDFEPCETGSADAIDVALNDGCDIGWQTGSFTPVVEWQVSGYTAYGPPVSGQLDDDDGDGDIDADDIVDILYQSNTGSGLICVNGRNGQVQWTSTTVNDGTGGLAIADLEGDGVPEIIASQGPGTVVVMDNNAIERWRRTTTTGTLNWFMYPQVADLDGDGTSEIVAAKSIFSADGDLLGTGQYGHGGVTNESSQQGAEFAEGSVPAIVDLNGDGTLEVVVGNAAYRMDGSALYYSGGEDGNVAVANFDDDDLPEIVAVNGNRVWTMQHDFTLTGWSATFPNTNYIGPPAAADLDGDGYPEFIVAGSGEIRAYHWDGSLLWMQPVQDSSGAAGAITFDFEMDGYPEVVYADEEWLRVFDGLTGAPKLLSPEHSSSTGFENPVVADFDGDGEVEIAVLHGHGTYGLTVFGDANHSWPPGRQVWHQHAYFITNVNDDLSIPAHPDDNWLLYNNYRSAAAGLPPSEWHDVKPEVVEVCDACPGGLTVLVRVWNGGTRDLQAGLHVVVRVGPGGPIVGHAVVSDPIGSGRSSEGVAVEVTGLEAYAGEALFVEVDRDADGYDLIAECDEQNNITAVPVTCD